MIPRVSICVPNLNHRPFLDERFETILGQSLQDWEAFVYDGESDDGAWQVIQDFARRDGRLRIAQGPREGSFRAWNECLRQTKAEYVYIATSDDTMAPDCLEKMVAALERHSDCDLAHCPLVFIDQAGAPTPEPHWPECTVFGHHNGELSRRPHLRRAPYDGLLHLTGRLVFVSITQLLIRRSLFSKIGDFPSQWGSVGDFNWEMRATMVANTVHVPETWASFREHPKQLTAKVDFASLEHVARWEDMIRDALEASSTHLNPAVAAGLRGGWLDRTAVKRTYYAGLRHRRRAFDRRFYQLQQLVRGTAPARSEVIRRLLGRPKWPEIAPGEIKLWLESMGCKTVIRL